jgi:anti-sigma regulatory factor (Ser/Thr protein kinase)
VNANADFYGRERLKAFLDANAGLPVRELLSSLGSDITAFSAGAEQADDITMLALRIPESKKKSQLCSLTLNADIAEFPALADFISGELDKVSCPEKIRGHIELAAEEIFVNIVKYAYQQQPGKATVECLTGTESGRTTMTLSFTDRGCAFNPLEYTVPDTGLPIEERQPGKLGILIVKKTMDTIFYSREDGVNRLRFSKSWQTP